MIRFLLTLCLLLASLPAWAQDAGLQRGQLEKSQTFNPDAALSNEQTEKIYQECRKVFPPRFTPGTVEYYCTCSSAATQGVLTSGEYESLQIERNRVTTNPVYEKYVTQVVTPCLDTPTMDIEYYSCVMNRSIDPSIKNVIKYCECISNRLYKHVQKQGDADAMSRLDNRFNRDPMEALWMSEGYLNATRQAYEQCRRPDNWQPSRKRIE